MYENYGQQPYWMHQMNPQINPYQRMQPNVQPIQNQYLQQMPQQATGQGLNGRTVNDISEVTANEIPMDGNKAVFIRSDGSEIYTKQWTANGTIATMTYKPVLKEQGNLMSEEEKANTSGLDAINGALNDFIGIVNARFDRIESRLPIKEGDAT